MEDVTIYKVSLSVGLEGHTYTIKKYKSTTKDSAATYKIKKDESGGCKLIKKIYIGKIDSIHVNDHKYINYFVWCLEEGLGKAKTDLWMNIDKRIDNLKSNILRLERCFNTRPRIVEKDIDEYY